MGDEAWARVVGSKALYPYIVHIYVCLRTICDFDISAYNRKVLEENARVAAFTVS